MPSSSAQRKRDAINAASAENGVSKASKHLKSIKEAEDIPEKIPEPSSHRLMGLNYLKMKEKYEIDQARIKRDNDKKGGKSKKKRKGRRARKTRKN